MGLRNSLSENKILILDGAMGTELARRGLEAGGNLNLTAADHILDFHREYAEMGVDCVTTNTFTMNRIYIESHSIKTDLRKVNQAGVNLARQAVGSSKYVLGDLGPTGRLLKPYGEYTEEEFIENYREAAAILVGAGVDGLIIETMTDLREALCALKGCRMETDLPVIVTLSFATTDKGGRTIMGSAVAEIAESLEENGADVLGANCGELTPLEMADIISLYKRHTALPLIAQPNAGRPKLKDGRTYYDMTADDFADGVMKCIENGAGIVGGCCGTTLDHMRAVVNRLRP